MKRAFIRVGLPVFLTLRALVSPVALGVCAIVEDAEGKILLVKHSYQPGWLLPGGGVGRGEPPEEALARELKEEVGFLAGSEPEFVRLYTRRAGWATNVIALYRIRGAVIDFKRNFEIRETAFFAADALPADTPGPVRRRIAEVFAGAESSPYW